MKKNGFIRVVVTFVFTITVMLTCAVTASAAAGVVFSDEYMTSPYYTRLLETLEATEGMSVMERTLAIAQSQEGYLNFATEGADIEQARADGKLWTGAELRMSENLTGNTEYTRWAQSCLLNLDDESLYVDYDWCAIFVSWCLYHAGYYNSEDLKRYYYSYTADPRIFYDADSWLASFNLDQRDVYYVPKARHKLEAMDWNTYYHVDVDPYDIPYKPGGVVFFSWDISGEYFDHVAIVADYDESTRVLTYINGNSDGSVVTYQMDLDYEGVYSDQGYVRNAEQIMGYAEYDEIRPLEKREINVASPTVTWSRDSSSGIKIRTDSESVIASVYMDREYYGSIIESNMVFHEGLLSIGRSELAGLPLGEHLMKLVFDDGEVELKLNITDQTAVPVKLLGDADADGEVSILDATAIQRTLASIPVPSFDEETAEADGDGELSILDATAIQRHLAGLHANENIGKPINLS